MREHELTSKRKSIPFTVAPDGAFTVEDVPPGRYTVSIEFRSAAEPPQILEAFPEFEIPTGHPAHTPFDVGTLAVERRVVLRPGDDAPDFQAAMLDDRIVKLSVRPRSSADLWLNSRHSG